MIYIKKEGVTDELNQQIITIRKSEEWKKIPESNTEAIRKVFDTDFPKNEIKKILVHEQKGICAYCMRRIYSDSHSRIEHWTPLSKNKEKAIDYNNMLGVCDGGERVSSQQVHILCCDAKKKEIEITTSPLNKIQMDKIAYRSDGTIYTDPMDKEMERDINEVLMLNGIQKSDGSVRDTSTEILKGRRDAYDRAKIMMKTLDKKDKCSSAQVQKLIDALLAKEEYEEYLGVKLYYFKKKYASLLKRGL